MMASSARKPGSGLRYLCFRRMVQNTWSGILLVFPIFDRRVFTVFLLGSTTITSSSNECYSCLELVHCSGRVTKLQPRMVSRLLSSSHRLPSLCMFGNLGCYLVHSFVVSSSENPSVHGSYLVLGGDVTVVPLGQLVWHLLIIFLFNNCHRLILVHGGMTMHTLRP